VNEKHSSTHCCTPLLGCTVSAETLISLQPFWTYKYRVYKL
jgi:hypothetical protein